MANEAKVTVIITADANGVVTGVRMAEDATKRMAENSASWLNQLKSNWMAVTAAAYGAYAALQKIWDSMQKAADTMEAFDALDAMARRFDTTAEQLAKRISVASDGLIGMSAAAKTSAEALAKGFTPEQLVQLAKYAPVLDDFSTSIHSSAEAFDTLVKSLATGRERAILQLLGATADLKTVTDESTSSMTRAEKATKLTELAISRLSAIQAAGVGTTRSASDNMERFNNSLSQLGFFVGQVAIVLGGPLMATINSVLSFVYMLVGGFTGLGATIFKLTDDLGLTQNKADEWYKSSEKWFGRAADQALQARDNFKMALDQVTRLGSYTSGLSGKGTGVIPTLGEVAGNSEAQKVDEVQARLNLVLALKRQEWKQEREADKQSQDALLSGLGIQRARWAEEKRARDEDQAAFESRLGLERERLRQEQEAYQKRVEYETTIRDINEEQKRILFESRAATVQESFGAIGGGDFAQSLNQFTALQEGQDPYQQEYDRWAALQDQKIMAMEQYGADEAAIKDAYRQYEIRADETQTQQKLSMAKSGFGMMGALAEAFYNASGKRNLAAFRVMQAMRIGETIMDTYKAAVAAYSAMAGIPIVGPALGAVAAAAAIAFGMMQVRQIASQKPGGGGTASASVPSGPSIPSTTTPTAPNVAGVEDDKKKVQSPTVNIYIAGNVIDQDAFARELVPSITKAIADNANQ